MSTDAFAAAVGKGAAMHKPRFPDALRAGVIFGTIEGLEWPGFFGHLITGTIPQRCSMVKRQQFTAEFKREAVRQMQIGDKPIAQLSRELGVPRNRLYKWSSAVQAVGEKEAFPGSGRRSPEQAELMRLRRALASAEMELEILKKAEAYFASAPARGTPGSKSSKPPTR